jgi:putative ABC transport system ATP-binding protein
MSEASAVAPAIEVIDVEKTFEHGIVHALNGVTLTVGRGEWVALVGPSGCGKSTLLHLLAALDMPTGGRIVVNGQDLASFPSMDRYRRFEVGLVFQLHNLLPNLTAIQNVEVAMFGAGLNHHEQRERARELLAAVDLSHRENVRVPGLSGGERQRLSIARALANHPSIILADEPTGALDSAAAVSVMELFERIRQERGVTILLVTHDKGTADAADRLIHMRDGRVVDAPAVATTH